MWVCRNHVTILLGQQCLGVALAGCSAEDVAHPLSAAPHARDRQSLCSFRRRLAE